ncbi:MAG TPA: DNA polymerase I [Rectinemataceae bacterium]|nr:DNA polymerase I [Rectinemataceae bacterium]
MKPPLYLLDSYAFIYRSYFAFMSRPLRSPAGRNVGAAFGFFKFVFQLFDERNPGAFAAVFDPKGKTFRHEMYAEYKATRQKTPEDLHEQVPLVEEMLRALGVPILRAEGFEADDVIATLAERARAENRECWIVSGDKDLLQLVGGSVKALRPGSGFVYQSFGPEEVKAEWGVGPEGILDYLTLTGDASDNVPGVKGIGDKTAGKLLAQFGSVDEIYARLDEVKPDSLRKKLEEGRESAVLSKKLITLDKNVKLPVADLDELELSGLDRAAANALFIREGMKSLISGTPPDEGGLFPTAAAKRARAATAEGEGAASATGAGGGGEGGASKADGVAAPVATGRPGETKAPAELLGEGSYAALTDRAALAAFVDACIAAGRVAFDCETDSLDERKAQLVGFSLSIAAREAVYVPIRCPEGSGLPLAEALAELARLFSRKEILVVGQNIKYDYSVLAQAGLVMTCPLADTMIAAFLLDADALATAGGGGGYGLEALAERRLGYHGIEFGEVVPKGGSFAEVPLEKATRYAAEDADLTLRLWLLMEGELEAAGLGKLFRELEMPLVPLLSRMEAAGIEVDAPALREFGSEIELRLARLQGDIYELCGREFNIASPKQLQEVLFVERKLPSGKKTKTGFSTDTSVLEELASLDPVPAKILEHRGLSKLAGTYVGPLAEIAEREGRVHTHYSQVGAATGRLSSRDPNLQNIPIRDEDGRRIRAAFKAAEGMSLVSADYSQIELVVLAHLSGDPGLAQAFREGIDVHRRTASLIFKVFEEMVSPEQRRIAKTINFGVIYGMSAFRLSNELKIPRSEAQSFIDAYFKTYAGVGDFIKKTVAEVEKTGYATTILGRRRPIRGINSGNKTEKSAAERVAVNTPIQGSAADIMKLAMLAVDAALRKELPAARILLQVHDELIVEAPEALAGRTGEIVKREMEGAIILSVPLRASIEEGQRWGEMH